MFLNLWNLAKSKTWKHARFINHRSSAAAAAAAAQYVREKKDPLELHEALYSGPYEREREKKHEARVIMSTYVYICSCAYTYEKHPSRGRGRISSSSSSSSAAAAEVKLANGLLRCVRIYMTIYALRTIMAVGAYIYIYM
ncbi:unnamed protein product [Trichogramma brassicae]|uniref:Uncharacterized protein n=1 Tax=Trichogramma brassicae TaxID=86971 RepID=A0A6H5I176_9HYME|nr:unnamed protein product [Trichogramma brassicae]